MYADIQMMNSVFAASIDSSAKIVLFAIIYHANKDTHEAFPSWRTLMDEFESGGVVASRYPRTGQERRGYRDLSTLPGLPPKPYGVTLHTGFIPSGMDDLPNTHSTLPEIFRQGAK